jgi:hypothetical protein
VKVKLLNEDELVGYVSVKKFSNRPNNFKYKLTFGDVMAAQGSATVARTGWIEATSEQDAVRQVTSIVCAPAVPFEGEHFLNWCNNFADSLRRAYPEAVA